MPIHLHTVYGGFGATTTEWRSCDRDHMVHKTKKYLSGTNTTVEFADLWPGP